jgi:Holliday junction resolvase RusA-like endonuclease|tara:strand:+ start:291 stop:716 length:426 start_codon:yes stop_codon:yes gene_type:complete
MKKWFIPGNVPSSKNGRRWTGKYFISSKTVMKYRKDTKSFYQQYAPEFQKELKKHKLPVKIAFTFIRGTKHKFDYINPAQTVQDDMVTHGWIEDDNMVNMIPVFKSYEYDKENPGVIIEIIKNNQNGKKRRIKKDVETKAS